jgi:hypothetical protein
MKLSVSQSKVEFKKKQLVRECDEWEHRYKCGIERRNKLIKELNHLKEIN